jgi:hypothetical protein
VHNHSDVMAILNSVHLYLAKTCSKQELGELSLWIQGVGNRLFGLQLHKTIYTNVCVQAEEYPFCEMAGTVEVVGPFSLEFDCFGFCGRRADRID